MYCGPVLSHLAISCMLLGNFLPNLPDQKLRISDFDKIWKTLLVPVGVVNIRSLRTKKESAERPPTPLTGMALKEEGQSSALLLRLIPCTGCL